MLALATSLLTVTLGSAFAQMPGQGFKVRGTEILTPDGKPIHIRGFNVLWWVPVTEQDAVDIQALHVNCVRYMFGYTPTGKFDPSKLGFRKDQVDAFTHRGIWVIPVIHDFRKDKLGPYDSQTLQQEFLELWDYVMTQLKDEPYIAAWEPINEPHDTQAARVDVWYASTIAHFRKIDPKRPIVVEGANYSWPENLEPSLVQKAKNVIYSFHTYGPWEYTSQDKQASKVYPGKWSRSELAKAIEPAIAFRRANRVPVWCGEWGVPTYCPGYQQWIKDVSSILEENKLPWTYWGWALKPQNPTDDTYDVNRQKPEVYGLMKELFARLSG